MLKKIYNHFFRPKQQTANNTQNAGVGVSKHAQRMRVRISKVGADNTVNAHEEVWQQHGYSLLGEETSTLIETASNEVVSPKQLRSRCSVCGGYEAQVTRCFFSDKTLCLRCAKKVRLPDGKEVIATPKKAFLAKMKYNTWEELDHKRK